MEHSYQTYDGQEMHGDNLESREPNQSNSQIVSSNTHSPTAAKSIVVWSYMMILGVTALYTILG